MTFTPNVFPTMLNQPLKGLTQIVNANGTSQETVVTAGGNGSKVLNLTATSTDTAAQTVQVSVVRSSTSYLLATTSVPASSGDAAGTAPVDLLAILPNTAHDQDGQPYLFLNSGDTLVVALASGSVTSGKTVSIHSDYANF
jgi:type II secretory pathway component PulK